MANVSKAKVKGTTYNIVDSGRGQANGVATLDANGKVPGEQLPDSVIQMLEDIFYY